MKFWIFLLEINNNKTQIVSIYFLNIILKLVLQSDKFDTEKWDKSTINKWVKKYYSKTILVVKSLILFDVSSLVIDPISIKFA